MTELNDREQMRERMRELGRASGRARRRRRARDVGIVAWDVLNADPEPVIRPVYESGNAVAIVDMIRFAQEAKSMELKARERDLNERERQMSQREREADDWGASARGGGSTASASHSSIRR